MASKQAQYTKLSGRSTFSVQKSFLAEDHLLVVDGHYTETYKRLYFKDIEAVLVCPTSSGMIIAAIMTLLSASLVLLGITNDLLFTIPAIIPAIFAILLFYGGGSVRFGVQTAVQTVLLDGVKSKRKARKVKDQLVAQVERVQGVLTEPMLRAVLQEGASHSLSGASQDPVEDVPAPPETTPAKSKTKLKLKIPSPPET